MPRVNYQEKYNRHRFLNMAWFDPNLKILFAMVDVNAQWLLHDYYLPTKHIKYDEFVKHCKEINKTHPTLASTASK